MTSLKRQTRKIDICSACRGEGKVDGVACPACKGKRFIKVTGDKADTDGSVSGSIPEAGNSEQVPSGLPPQPTSARDETKKEVA